MPKPLSKAALAAAERLNSGEALLEKKHSSVFSEEVRRELAARGMQVAVQGGRWCSVSPSSFAFLLRDEKSEFANRNRIAKAIRAHGGRIMPYSKLPIPARYAMAYYMAVDGEAWELPTKTATLLSTLRARSPQFLTAFKRQLLFLTAKYSKCRFGLVQLPRQVAIDLCWECRESRDDAASPKTFQQYHKWYLPFVTDKHPANDPWPSILDSSGYSFLEDGWHRFHRYIDLGMEQLPFLYYPGTERGCRRT
jgi:hypothetical protein